MYREFFINNTRYGTALQFIDLPQEVAKYARSTTTERCKHFILIGWMGQNSKLCRAGVLMMDLLLQLAQFCVAQTPILLKSGGETFVF